MPSSEAWKKVKSPPSSLITTKHPIILAYSIRPSWQPIRLRNSYRLTKCPPESVAVDCVAGLYSFWPVFVFVCVVLGNHYWLLSRLPALSIPVSQCHHWKLGPLFCTCYELWPVSSQQDVLIVRVRLYSCSSAFDTTWCAPFRSRASAVCLDMVANLRVVSLSSR